MAVAGLASPAGASTRAPGLVSAGIISAKKAPPNVNIATPGPVFNPTSVTVKKVSGKVFKKCSTTGATKFSFTISNTTSATQQLEYTAQSGGSGDVGPALPSGDYLGICLKKKGNYGPVLTLVSNTATTLSITAT
ncbi:MAG TPA: hypothetical protein VIJ09_07840 [Acidimicrobiales bacterium]